MRNSIRRKPRSCGCFWKRRLLLCPSERNRTGVSRATARCLGGLLHSLSGERCASSGAARLLGMLQTTPCSLCRRSVARDISRKAVPCSERSADVRWRRCWAIPDSLQASRAPAFRSAYVAITNGSRGVPAPQCAPRCVGPERAAHPAPAKIRRALPRQESAVRARADVRFHQAQ